MAVTTDFSHLTPLQDERYRDIEVNATATVLVDSVVTVVYAIEVDNTADVISYFKMYLSDGPSPGTTVPIFVFPIPANTKWFIPLGDQDGYTFTGGASDGVSFACVTEPGTGGTTNPTATVKATIWTD